MKIVNGNGKIVEGQYIANRQDQLETMALIKVMEQRVKSIIAKKIGKLMKIFVHLRFIHSDHMEVVLIIKLALIKMETIIVFKMLI